MRQIVALLCAFVLSGCAEVSGFVSDDVRSAVEGAQSPLSGRTPPNRVNDVGYAGNLKLLDDDFSAVTKVHFLSPDQKSDLARLLPSDNQKQTVTGVIAAQAAAQDAVSQAATAQAAAQDAAAQAATAQMAAQEAETQAAALKAAAQTAAQKVAAAQAPAKDAAAQAAAQDAASQAATAQVAAQKAAAQAATAQVAAAQAAVQAAAAQAAALKAAALAAAAQAALQKAEAEAAATDPVKLFYNQGLLVGKLNCRAYIEGMTIADRTLDTTQFGVNIVSTIANGLLATFGAPVGAYNGLNIGTNAADNTLHFTSSEFTFDVSQNNIESLITKNIQNAAEVTAGTDGANIKTYQDAYNALVNGMDACKLTQIKYALTAAVQKATPNGTQPNAQSSALSITAANDNNTNKMVAATGTTKLTITDTQDDQIAISATLGLQSVTPDPSGTALTSTNGSFVAKGPLSAVTYDLVFSGLTKGQVIVVSVMGSKSGLSNQSAATIIGTQ